MTEMAATTKTPARAGRPVIHESVTDNFIFDFETSKLADLP
jgi:hypothetical protein